MTDASGIQRMLPAISGRGLFFAAAALSVALMVGSAVSNLAAARAEEARLFEVIEDRLLTRLEETGISGLATALDQLDQALVPGQNDIEVALWRVRGGERMLVSETRPGVAFAFSGDAARFEGAPFALRAVDVSAASENWLLPMGDVALTFGVRQPSHEVAAARRTTLFFSLAFGAALSLIFLLDLAHWRRYRRSVDDINALLDRYSAGETGIRIKGDLPARELRVLGQHLNSVLPKLDALFAEIRSISAHLAHELKNPLQAIRSDVRRLEAAEEGPTRAALADGVDQVIDSANGRLETVMQLFRLQADAEIAMQRGVSLGPLVEDIVYDREEAAMAKSLTLALDLAETVSVTGNAHLIELMVDNLMSNAIKYAAPGTEIAVSLVRDGEAFTLDIENAGELPGELAATAFSRFVQGAEHGGSTGAGLGLALVASIAAKHGMTASLANASAGRVRARVTGGVDA